MTAVAERIEPTAEPGTAVALREERRALSFPEMMEIGNQLVKTGFLPEHIKNGAQAAAIILTGQELGMAPMRAIRSLNLVKGKVTENADSQLARFKTDGGRAVFKVLSETHAELWLRHPNGDEHTERFTMVNADAAGLTKPSRSGEPSMFTKFPKAMLRSRVITAGLKSIGWEGGAGTYDPSELAPVVTATVDNSHVEEAQGVTVEDAPKALTLEEARVMVIPGEPGVAWRGHAGKKLDECRNNLLIAVGKWTLEQQRKEDGYRDALTLMRACKLVLTARANGSLTEPPKPPKPAEARARAAQGPRAPAPGINPKDGLPGDDDDLPF